MALKQVQDIGDWNKADGFLEGPASEPLTLGTDLTDYTLYAEVFAPRKFDLILRKTTETTLIFAVDRDALSVEFQLGEYRETVSIPETLFTARGSREQALIEAEGGADEFRVRLNGQMFFFTPSAESGPLPAAGDVAVQSHSAGERWSWVTLTDEPRLAVGRLDQFAWDLPPDAKIQRDPYILLSLSVSSGMIGDEVTVSGAGFTPQARVEIGGQLQTVLSSAADSIVFRIAPETESGPLIVYDAEALENRTSPVDFGVQRQPYLTGVVPEYVAPGATFRIFGNYFVEGDAVVAVSLEEVGPLEVVSASPKSLEVRVPEGEYVVEGGSLTLKMGALDAVTFAGYPVTVQDYNYIDLIELAREARWSNGRDSGGILPFGTSDQPQEGSARWLSDVKLENGETYDRALYTQPPAPELQYLNGFYRDQTIPPGARLFLQFGFRDDARETDGVRFRMEFYSRTDRKWFTVLPEVFKGRDGGLDRRVIDLDDILPFPDEETTIKGAFSLTMMPGSTSQDDHACWAECRVGFPRALPARMELSAPELDFGAVAPGVSVDRELRVSNTGPGPLQIDSVAFNRSVFAHAESLSFPLIVPPGDERAFPVRLTPEGEFEGARLTIRSNDQEHPVQHVPLLATTVAPIIRLSTEALDFPKVIDGISHRGPGGLDPTMGRVLDGGKATKPPPNLTIYNDGTDTLRLTSFVLQGDAGFTVSVPTPVDVAPGAEYGVRVGYDPADESADAATLYIYSNAETKTVALTGGGREIRYYATII